MPGNLLLNPRHHKFHVLGYKLLLFFFEYCRTLIWTQLSYLEAGITFWVLLLSFVGRVQSSLYSVGTILCFRRTFHSGWREHELLALWEVQWLLHLLILVILSSASVSSCSYADRYQPKTLRNTSAGCWSSLCLWSSFLPWKLWPHWPLWTLYRYFSSARLLVSV